MSRTVSISPDTARTLRQQGGTWAIYENVDLGHPGIGHLKFLRVGGGCTFQEPPKRLPDTETEINWRYWLVGTIQAADIPDDGEVSV
jgi:hypothetical protein